MGELEDAIREAAKNGRLNGLTLWKKEGGWQGNARWSGNEGWSCQVAVDPVDALLRALRGELNRDLPRDTKPAPDPVVESNGVFD